MARRHPARRPDTQLAANFPRENWRGREAAVYVFWEGHATAARGRIPEASGESIFQRIALTRTFYAGRRRCRARHAGLPPNGSATALKTTPTTL
jgi:hypothetical protein